MSGGTRKTRPKYWPSVPDNYPVTHRTMAEVIYSTPAPAPKLKIRVIGWLIDRGYISAAFGRGLEAFAVGLLAAALSASLTALSAGLEGGLETLNWESVLTAGITAGWLYIRKAGRDAAAETARALQAEAAAAKAEADAAR
jgi:hypothetical protein